MVIAIEPRGKGMLGVTLRYPYEIRKEADYFDEIPDEKIPRDMLDLAVHIVETKAGHFEPQKFTDHYENALKELIKKKQRGEKIEKPRVHPQAQVINLMEALRQSAAAESGGARSHPRRAPTRHRRTPANRPNARARKAS
jgi:DNA end-binding protein Ku